MHFGYIEDLLSDPRGTLIFLLLALPGRLLAISCHEAAHAYVANRCGDPTARLMGRLTLNPFKHLDPVGVLMMLVLGLGGAAIHISLGDSGAIEFSGSALAAIVGIVLNKVIPERPDDTPPSDNPQPVKKEENYKF